MDAMWESAERVAMRQHRSDPAAIEAEIAHLRSLAIDALRRRWRVIFGNRVAKVITEPKKFIADVHDRR
jgi:hypothetical protein